MIIANPIYDVVFKRLMKNDRVAKFFIGTLLERTIESIEIKPQEYTFVKELALDKKKNNPEYFEQFFGANHLDKGLTKIAHEGGRAHGLLNVTLSDFFSLKVTVPTYEEQIGIAKYCKRQIKKLTYSKPKQRS